MSAPQERKPEIVAYLLDKPTKIKWLAQLRAIGKTPWLASRGQISVSIERSGWGSSFVAFEDGAYAGTAKLSERRYFTARETLIVTT